MVLLADQSFGFGAESSLRESRRHPRDEKDPGIASSPAPTTATGLVAQQTVPRAWWHTAHEVGLAAALLLAPRAKPCRSPRQE